MDTVMLESTVRLPTVDLSRAKYHLAIAIEKMISPKARMNCPLQKKQNNMYQPHFFTKSENSNVRIWKQ